MSAKKKDIFWFIILRLIVITSLIVSAFIIQSGVSALLIGEEILFLIVTAYGLSVVYLILYAWGKHLSTQAYIQIVFDLLLITVLVYLSGGLRGNFYFLYIFEIIGASMVLNPRATYITAALSSVFFGLLVDGLYFGIIPYFDLGRRSGLSLGAVLNNILIAWGSFFLVAFLMNKLTGSLTRTRSALKQAQKELEVKKHLALAGEFSAQLAHEIRNPLAAISGSVQVLRDELHPSGDQKQLMDIVIDESKRISLSIEQFLNLASPGTQTFSNIDLSGLLSETIILLQRGGVLDDRYRLEGNYRSVRAAYYANRNQFKQIFWNLIKNGIKAMPEGGTLTIDLFRDKTMGLHISVSDTGVGMGPEDKARLFEPFYSKFEDGKGIGMAIVKRIVDDYNGRIEVASQPDKGSSISIILPLNTAARDS